MLILMGIMGILIRVKAIELSSWKAWVQHSMVTHLTCSILPRVPEFIHNKSRNRLQPQRANDLAYVFSNMRVKMQQPAQFAEMVADEFPSDAGDDDEGEDDEDAEEGDK